MTHEPLLGTTEVAKVFDVTRKAVWNWIQEGKLPAIRTPGGQWKIKTSDVEAFLNAERGEQPGSAA